MIEEKLVHIMDLPNNMKAYDVVKGPVVKQYRIYDNNNNRLAIFKIFGNKVLAYEGDTSPELAESAKFFMEKLSLIPCEPTTVKGLLYNDGVLHNLLEKQKTVSSVAPDTNKSVSSDIIQSAKTKLSNILRKTFFVNSL